MTNFIDKRKRFSYSDNIMGEVTDPDEVRNHVRYENGRDTRGGYLGDGAPTVNWSAMGSVDLDTARRYAQQILAACDAAEVMARDFEPRDEVIPLHHAGTIPFAFDPHKERCFVSEVHDGGMLTVEVGIPGDTWQKTVAFYEVKARDFERVLPDWAKDAE